MIEQSSIVTIVSTLGSASFVLYGVSILNKNNIENLKESFKEFKGEIKEEILKEKRHAMELAGQRIDGIEKDVDEIWPRLRNVEDSSKKNCLVVTQIQKDCERKHKENT